MARIRPFSIFSLLVLGAVAFAGFQAYRFYGHWVLEKKILKEIIARLEGESRIAEAIVTDVAKDPESSGEITTLKFLEYDGQGQALTPKIFRFHGNLIQFQSLVVRFADQYIRYGDRLKGKSAYVFWKAFVLDGPNTEEFDINRFEEIPEGYKIGDAPTAFEKEFWQNFWRLALDPKYARKQGVKNAQIEAPGTRFIPGMVYTLKIEHDGGIRIDASPIPEILKGEVIK